MNKLWSNRAWDDYLYSTPMGQNCQKQLNYHLDRNLLSVRVVEQLVQASFSRRAYQRSVVTSN